MRFCHESLHIFELAYELETTMLNFTKIKFIFFFLLLTTQFAVLHGISEKPMVVIIPSYNNQEWVHKNLTSVFEQDYSNYRVIYIDDASTDGTADEVEHLVKVYSQESRFLLIRNNNRQGGLANIYHAIHGCRDPEIILNLDGDDWLFSNQVLKIVNNAYSNKNVWLTHGTLVEYPHYVQAWSIPIPEEIVKKNSFRTYRCPSHLKTYYAWLFKKIKTEDLKYEGEFFPMTWDQAIMFPMLEMAGKHHAFIPEVLYVYNMRNPLNDNKVNAKLQNDLETLIRGKSPYARLPDSYNAIGSPRSK
jgi:glycosyltransferase involved in cell wall biosynthesis